MSNELAFSASSIFNTITNAGIGENMAYSFFDEVEPAVTYGGRKMYTLRQANKWIKENKVAA